MIAKPLNLILVYIVTVFNMVVLCSPLIALAAPFITVDNNIITIEDNIFHKLKFAFLFICFLVSFFMLVYLVIDFIFGFSVRASLKKCVSFEKIKDYDFLTDLFNQVKDKFGERNVKLYVKNSDEINAYAVSSLGRKAIVLTRGLIHHYLEECDDPKVFLYALRSVIGHEMSHLVNKDFLPTFLIITNQKVTNFVSNILFYAFNILIKLISYLPFASSIMIRTIKDSYMIVSFVTTAFNRLVVYNLYEFLRRFVSRSIEYRCDMQSAKAFGGKNMAFALSLLGESGYFTLFSTHPATKSRMNRVENIKISDSIVYPRFIDSLSNYFSLMFLVVICLYFAKKANIDVFVKIYLQNHEVLHRKLAILWHLISQLL